MLRQVYRFRKERVVEIAGEKIVGEIAVELCRAVSVSRRGHHDLFNGYVRQGSRN